MENSEDRLSPSERRTLQHLADGELHASELDWVAIQRLKRLGLARGAGYRHRDHTGWPPPLAAPPILSQASLMTWSCL